MKDNTSELDAQDAADAAVINAGKGSLTAEQLAEFEANKEARAEKRAVYKKRMLANISFIGHLYGMLTSKIMHYCVTKLLAQGKIENTDEESVEALCRLLTLIGKKFEEDDKNDKNARFPLYMQLLERLTKASHLSKRVQFAVQDLLDLRNGGWVLSGSKAWIDRRALTLTRDELRAKLAEEERAKAEASASRGAISGIPGGRLMGSGRGLRDNITVARGTTPGAPAQVPPRRGPASFGAGAARAAPPTQGGRGTTSPGSGSAEEWTTVGGGKSAQVTSAASTPAGPVSQSLEVLEGEALSRRVRGILEEFVGGRSNSELTDSVKELAASPRWTYELVLTAFAESVKGKANYREGIAIALPQLASEELLPKAEALEALRAFSNVFNDAAADAPALANLIAPVSFYFFIFNCFKCD
jgi:MIF4G domain